MKKIKANGLFLQQKLQETENGERGMAVATDLETVNGRLGRSGKNKAGYTARLSRAVGQEQ